MSKRNFQIDPNDRFVYRNASGKRFPGARNSKTHISTTKSPRAKGFGYQKKVKFTAKDIVSSTTCRLEVSPIPLERKEVTTYANQPKTSEYAFFKKLKEDAGQIYHSNSLQKDAYLSKKPEPNDCFRERTNDVRVSSKCFNRSTLIENMPTVNSDSFLSPSGGALKKSDEYCIGTISTQKHFRGYGDTFQPGDMFIHEEIQSVLGKTFFRKRQKLRQWVADTSFPDIDKLCSKGHDIVTMLLTRLFSNSNEENKYNYPKSGRAVTATRHDLFVSQESDIQYKEHYHMPRKKLLELDSSSYSSDQLSSPMFHKSDDRIISCADFSTYHSLKFCPSYSTTEPECNFGGTASFSSHCMTDPECNFSETARFSANSVMTHDCLFNEQEHKTLAWNHFSEPGKPGPEPYPLLLENGLDSPADEINILVSQGSDIQYREQHHMPMKKLLELDTSSYSSDHLSYPIFQRSDDRIILQADFSTYHSHKFRPTFSTTEPECNFGGTASFSPHRITNPECNFGETTRFNANSVITHGFLFNELEHQTLAWNHLKEPGKLGGEPYPLLLENGLDSSTDKINIPITHNNAKLNRSPALLTSLGNCKERMLYNILGACGLCSSSILPNQPLDLNSMLDSGLLRYQGYRFGEYVCEDLDTDFNHNSLSLTYNKDHLKLSEECQSDNSCVPDSFYLSPNRHL